MNRHVDLTASQLRADIYKILDRVAEEGIEVHVLRKGRRIRIRAEAAGDRLSSLTPHPDYLSGDPKDLVHLDWSGEWRPD